uniref:Uncharacterized protein n=1 Tax=Setaria italica TaxID=4555 RepID=K3YY99_SETIT
MAAKIKQITIAHRYGRVLLAVPLCSECTHLYIRGCQFHGDHRSMHFVRHCNSEGTN